MLSVYSLSMNQSGTIGKQSEVIISPYIMFKPKTDSMGLNLIRSYPHICVSKIGLC